MTQNDAAIYSVKETKAPAMAQSAFTRGDGGDKRASPAEG